MALERALVDQAETCRLRRDRCVLKHRVDALVRIAFIDAERGVASSEIPQSLCLVGINIANGIVANRRVALRSAIENPSDRPVLHIALSLRAGEEV